MLHGIERKKQKHGRCIGSTDMEPKHDIASYLDRPGLNIWDS